MGFIEEVATYVAKYAPQFGICVYSPIIAQAVLESGSGTSNKVCTTLPNGQIDWRHNYFGLKWRNGRCACSNAYFEEFTQEQNADGTYRTIVAKFFRFSSLEQGVLGYFQWTNTSNYANLKGVTDPRTYLENIKADQYASSHNYVENVMAVVTKYNLTKYDPKPTMTTLPSQTTGGSRMRVNIHAGHNPDGKAACGAVGLIRESTEARKVVNKVIQILQQNNCEVYDCTCNDGANQSDVLKKIVSKCNLHKVDIDVSVHFNAGAKDRYGNGRLTGTEVFVYDASSASVPIANRVVSSIASLGFTNRGIKISKSLYFLKNTVSPSMLIECCFVDDADDVALYNVDNMAQAIAAGILGVAMPTTNVTSNKTPDVTLRVPFYITCKDYLNIRSGPNGTIVRENGCRLGTTYTIVEVSGNWGRLKSGAGWVTIKDKYVIKSNIS